MNFKKNIFIVLLASSSLITGLNGWHGGYWRGGWGGGWAGPVIGAGLVGAALATPWRHRYYDPYYYPYYRQPIVITQPVVVQQPAAQPAVAQTPASAPVAQFTDETGQMWWQIQNNSNQTLTLKNADGSDIQVIKPGESGSLKRSNSYSFGVEIAGKPVAGFTSTKHQITLEIDSKGMIRLLE